MKRSTLKKSQIVVGLIVLAFAMTAAWPAGAAEAESKTAGQVYDIDEVVVTANKFPVPADRVPGRIQVITASQIEAMSFERVDELLQHVTGVLSQRTDKIFEMSPIVTMRGLGGNVPGRTLVLLDGQPASTGDTGNMRWNRINTADIQRIEIFKGPGSSIYGSNAMGGVINIITKSPEHPFEGKVSAGYGSYNTRKGSVRLAGNQAGETGFFGQVAATGLKSDGFTSLTEASKDYDNRIDRFVEEFIVNTKAGYRFNPDNKIEMGYSYFNDQRGEGYRYNLEEGGRRDFDTNSLNLIYKGKAGPWQINLGGFYQNEAYFWHRDFANPNDLYTVNSDRKDYGTTASMSGNLGDNNTLTLGADTRASSVDAKDDYDYSDNYSKTRGNLDQYALFLQDELRLAQDRLIVTAGLRFDHVRFSNGRYESTISPFDVLSGDMDKNSWTALSPKLAARYHVNTDLSLYTSYARGFRAPILDALCRYGIFHGRFYDANPDLENETIDTLELGGELFLFGNRLDLSLSGYYSKGKDFIYSVDTGKTRFLWGRNRAVYTRENASEVIVKGLEADLKWQIVPAVKFFAGYTYNDSYIETFDKRPDLEGKQLEYVPQHTFSMGLDILTPIVNAGIALNHVGSQYIDDKNTDRIQSYHTVDLKLWRDLDFIITGLRADLKVQNLLDEEYLVSDDAKGTGMWTMVELTYQW